MCSFVRSTTEKYTMVVAMWLAGVAPVVNRKNASYAADEENIPRMGSVKRSTLMAFFSLQLGNTSLNHKQ